MHFKHILITIITKILNLLNLGFNKTNKNLWEKI